MIQWHGHTQRHTAETCLDSYQWDKIRSKNYTWCRRMIGNASIEKICLIGWCLTSHQHKKVILRWAAQGGNLTHDIEDSERQNNAHILVTWLPNCVASIQSLITVIEM